MGGIVVPFEFASLGRVEINLEIMTGDRKSFERVKFKLDSGSDFTLIKTDDLLRLGYTKVFLESCPLHENPARTVSASRLDLRFITGVSIKFGDRELQGCRIFFSLDKHTSNLIGCDILKYFNWSVDYDKGELAMVERKIKPKLSIGEKKIHIYTLDEGCDRDER